MYYQTIYKINYGYICKYRYYIGEKIKSSLHSHLKRNNNNGLSRKSQKKIANTIFWFLAATNRNSFFSGKRFVNVSFCTLTLPSEQFHSDIEIKSKCLNQFFIECKKYYNLRNYIWKLEHQKNGNVHFHILADIFLPVFFITIRPTSSSSKIVILVYSCVIPALLAIWVRSCCPSQAS